MPFSQARLRRLVPAMAALAIFAGLFFAAQISQVSGAAAERIASDYKFTAMPIAMPPGYHPKKVQR